MASHLTAAQKMRDHLFLNSLIILVVVFLLLRLLFSQLFFIKLLVIHLSKHTYNYLIIAHDPLIASHCTVNKTPTHSMPTKLRMFWLPPPSLTSSQAILLLTSKLQPQQSSSVPQHGEFVFRAYRGVNAYVSPKLTH